MSITAMFGFQQYKALANTAISGIEVVGKLPFTPNRLNGGDSAFTWQNYDGRMWIRSKPATGNRSPVVSCVCIQWGGYLLGTCYRRAIKESTASTDTNRLLDSSLRTPCMNFPLRAVYHDALDDSDKRYFTMGFRVWLPSGLENLTSLLAITTAGGDVSGGHELVGQSDFQDSDLVNATAYVEVTLDRQTGMVRRWISERELSRLTLSRAELIAFNDLHFQFGIKSTSTEGYRQSAINSSNSNCPTIPTYDPNTGAPTSLVYGLTDLYFLVDSGDINSPCTRLGDISVDYLPIKEFLLDQFWTPPTSLSPTGLLSRLKLDNTVAADKNVAGDTHAPAGKAIFDQPVLLDDEELIAMEVDVFAYRTADGATTMHVSAELDDQVLDSQDVTLPTDTLSSTSSTVQGVVIQKGLTPAAIKDLAIKIRFSE